MGLAVGGCSGPTGHSLPSGRGDWEGDSLMYWGQSGADLWCFHQKSVASDFQMPKEQDGHVGREHEWDALGVLRLVLVLLFI